MFGMHFKISLKNMEYRTKANHRPAAPVNEKDIES